MSVRALVIEHEASLPQRRHRLDTLHLFRLLAGVRQNGQLVATDVAFCRELVKDYILHEVQPLL